MKFYKAIILQLNINKQKRNPAANLPYISAQWEVSRALKSLIFRVWTLQNDHSNWICFAKGPKEEMFIFI